jgi:hypothetical protein
MFADRSIFFLQDKMQLKDILAFKADEVAGVELEGEHVLDGQISLQKSNKSK